MTPTTEHVDVLIIGAGLSGIGAACHLTEKCPGKSFAILESRDAIGGTWDIFRYPGIRSDSDMFTLGYSFRPWQESQALADGPSIRRYIVDTAREYGVDEKIRFKHRVTSAEWSSEHARWTVAVERTDTGETMKLTCGFLFGCTGYYRYDEGYTPELEGIESFQGEVIHPQHWPEDLEYRGKRVVVIGSGATAVTLVPAMAKEAAHVTMLQRSPSYILSIPGQDPVARLLRRILPMKAVYPIVRWKNVLLSALLFQLSRRRPRFVKKLLRAGVERELGSDYPIDEHFKPRYNPWDQRLCLVPDGNLFKALKGGKASIVTDRIETFTERGIKIESGEELEADIIVTATGLNLLPFGGIPVTVDGQEVEVPKTVGYKGMMLSGIPNMAMALGYTNASWTLKCDLVSEYVCRLINHMDEHGYAYCTPKPPDDSQELEPFIDLQAGYVLRSIDLLPRQGARPPWRLNQNYPKDIALLRHRSLEDEGIEFTRAGRPARREEPVAA